MQLLVIHSEDSPAIHHAAGLDRHQVTTVADYAEAMGRLGFEKYHLLLAPSDLGQEASLEQLAQAAAAFGLPIWLVADNQTLEELGERGQVVADFLPSPVARPVILQRFRLFQQQREYEKRITQLENLLRENASIDPLTNLSNRHFALQYLNLQWQRYRRQAAPFCCVLCDLDDFKQNNDLYGQRFGDSVLKSVAALLKQKARGSDLICRYEGQQFFLLCSDTDARGGTLLARRIQAHVASLDLQHEARITASCAVVQGERRYRTADQLLKAAEEALGEAKKRGFGQLEVVQPEADTPAATSSREAW